MTHEQIQDRVGSYDLLREYTDEHGREVVALEIRGARRVYLVEELDGSISGPLREDELTC